MGASERPGAQASFSLTRIDPDSAAEWEALRQLRNECRQEMTGYQGLISPQEQAAFRERATAPGSDLTIYLARIACDGEIVGFGMLTTRTLSRDWCPPLQGRWVTLGVTARHRGQGYGTRIYAALKGRYPHAAYAEIGKTNLPSRYAALRAGYRYIGQRQDAGTDLYLGEGSRE